MGILSVGKLRSRRYVRVECHSYAVNREFDSVGNSIYFVYRKGLPKGEQTKLTSVATYSNIDSALIYCL